MTPFIQNRRKETRLLAIAVLLITQNISIVGGFQSLGQLRLDPVIQTQSPNRFRRHVSLYESKEHNPPTSSNEPVSLNGDSSSDEQSKPDTIETEDIISAKAKKLSKGVLKDSNELPILRGKKLGLMWCAEEFCKDAVRERVSGDHNQIILDGPATGQVAYYWKPDVSPAYKKANGKEEASATKMDTTEPSILLLVKPNDVDLIRVAAGAVKELTNDSNNINVYMDSSLAGKLKFSYSVDNERIRLFEPEGTEGFGGNHVGLDDKRMSSFSGLPEDFDPPFDLICTLGGDGLLMHASMLFQGPVPPVISIAGGSLGFLTQFSREEMVDAIRIALGVSQGELKGSGASDGPEQDEFGMNNVFPPNMPSYPYEPLRKKQGGPSEIPRFSFGLGDRICLSIRMRLDCRIFNREGVLRARFNVLNEVVIDRGSSPYLANLECFCDDVHLTTVQADGVIFAT